VPTGRQGNLIVTSTKTVPETELRKQLIDEAKKQGKPYGLYFEDISSGFAVTTRSSPQAFSGDSAGGLSRVCGWPAG
jgi:TldD protein